MNLRATGTVQRVYSLLLTRYLKKTIIPFEGSNTKELSWPVPIGSLDKDTSI